MSDTLKRAPRHTPFAQVPEWILYSPKLSDRAVRLWGILDRHTNNDGVSWPGCPRLAGFLQCSVDSVKRAVKELAGIGAIQVEPYFRADGSQGGNQYVVVFDEPDQRTLPTGGRRIIRKRDTPTPHADPIPPRGYTENPPGVAPPAPPRTRALEREPENPRRSSASPPSLPGFAPSERNDASKPEDPNAGVAREVTKRAFERDPKPVPSFRNVLGVVKRVLAAGYSEGEMLALIESDDAVTWTIASLEFQLGQRRKAGAEPANPYDANSWL